MAKKKRTPEDAALLIDPVAAAGALVTLTATLGSILSNAQLAVLAIAQGKVPENVGAALLAGVAGAGELPAKKKRKKKVKLPEGYPKPPLRSGYSLFTSEFGEKGKPIQFADVGASWKKLSDAERARYDADNNKLFAKWAADMEEYIVAHPETEVPSLLTTFRSGKWGSGKGAAAAPAAAPEEMASGGKPSSDGSSSSSSDSEDDRDAAAAAAMKKKKKKKKEKKEQKKKKGGSAKGTSSSW